MKKLFLLVAGIFLFFNALAYAENIAVIVNSASPVFEVKASAGLNDVKEIFLGKVKYWKGAAIKPVNIKEKEVINKFLEKTCGRLLRHCRACYQWPMQYHQPALGGLRSPDKEAFQVGKGVSDQRPHSHGPCHPDS